MLQYKIIAGPLLITIWFCSEVFPNRKMLGICPLHFLLNDSRRYEWFGAKNLAGNRHVHCHYPHHFAYLPSVSLFFQEAISDAGYQFLRIDGTTKVSDREIIVKVGIIYDYNI